MIGELEKGRQTHVTATFWRAQVEYGVNTSKAPKRYKQKDSQGLFDDSPRERNQSGILKAGTGKTKSRVPALGA